MRVVPITGAITLFLISFFLHGIANAQFSNADVLATQIPPVKINGIVFCEYEFGVSPLHRNNVRAAERLSDTNKLLLLLSNAEREKTEIRMNNMEPDDSRGEIYIKNFDGKSSLFSCGRKSPRMIKVLMRIFQQVLGDQTFMQIDPSLTFFEF
jgi:hypothetical protein